MAVYVYKDAAVSIDGVDLTDHCIGATLKRGVETPDGTVMGQDTRTVMAGGLRTESLSITLFQDMGTGSVDETLDGALGSAVTVHVEPTGSGPSANNPSFTGSWVLTSYEPFSGNVGDRATCTAEFAPADDIERDVTA